MGSSQIHLDSSQAVKMPDEGERPRKRRKRLLLVASSAVVMLVIMLFAELAAISLQFCEFCFGGDGHELSDEHLMQALKLMSEEHVPLFLSRDGPGTRSDNVTAVESYNERVCVRAIVRTVGHLAPEGRHRNVLSGDTFRPSASKSISDLF